MLKIDLDTVAREPIQGHTSKGDQPKWQERGKWYKADHMGYEGLSEVVVSRLLAFSNVPEYVTYDPVLITYQGREVPGCVSKSFRGKDEILLPFERLHRAYAGRGLAETLGKISEPEERIRYTVDVVERVTGLTDVGKYLTMMLELDAFFLNEDRHTNNLAVIRNEVTKQYRLCPVFDNGLALLSDRNDYPRDQDIFECICRVRGKPFDPDYDAQVEAAEALYGMQLKFTFERSDVSRCLADLQGMYPQNVVDRVERVLYEQIRKWQVYF